jgi:hypothetical protein
MSQVLKFLGENWQPLVAYITLVWAAVTYFISRSRDLAWRRTEFLFRQAELLDSDADLVEVASILEQRHPKVTVRDVFGRRPRISRATVGKYRQRFDKFLNVYERISYAVFVRRTLSIDEVRFLGSFLVQIAEYPPLVEYCRDNGFREVLLLSKRMYSLPADLTEEHIDAMSAPDRRLRLPWRDSR